MPVNKTLFDEKNNVHLYTITSENQRLTAKVIDYGATLVNLIVADRNNVARDIVLGFDDLDGYQSKRVRNPYFGATIGRVANRIDQASFELNGKKYSLYANNGTNSLHGGQKGLDKLMWTESVSTSNDSLTLERILKHEEEGYPGEIKVQVTFTVTDEIELRIDYMAMLTNGSDQTIVNCTNHSYFNLNGAYSANSSKIFDHLVLMEAAHYLDVDSNLIPTGSITSVKGTNFDFLNVPRAIGERTHQIVPNGYDHCFVLEPNVEQYRIDPDRLKKAIEVYSPLTGLKMTMSTTEPAFQFYTGAKIADGHRPKQTQSNDSFEIGSYSGFCLEAQRFPDAVNRKQWRSQVLLTRDRPYRQTTIYKLQVVNE